MKTGMTAFGKKCAALSGNEEESAVDLTPDDNEVVFDLDGLDGQEVPEDQLAYVDD